MKRLAYLILLTLVMVGCGSRSGYFKLEGRLLNLNQGVFYVYSADGVMSGVGTIKIEGGRFAYEMPCDGEGTVVIVFPNYSELPVIVAPGKSVTITGDATHLKEAEVKGTDENKLMTSFRQRTANASPTEIDKLAAEFIRDNAKTLSAVYVLRRFFITNGKAAPMETARLVETVHQAQPKNGNVARMAQYVKMLKNATTGSRMPQFTAQDINGRTVTTADTRGKTTVVFTWATWSYESRNIMDRLKRVLNDNKGRLVLIGISLDASSKTCMNSLRNDSTATWNICDQLMFESPLMEKFAFTGVPDNIIYNAQGRIVERGLNADDIENRLKNILK